MTEQQTAPKGTHGGKRKGAGRPRSNDPLMKRTIALRTSEWQAMDEVREREGVTLADLMRLMIVAWAK